MRARVRGRRVAVIGGGWSGLAAAVEATTAGHQVCLFEMARELGGRARRAASGWPDLSLDNGQHILIGAYTECLRLMRLVGAEPERRLDRRPLTLQFPDGCGLGLPPGPAMSAFVRGVMAATHWPLRSRWALLAQAGRWALSGFRCDEQFTVAQFTAGLPGDVRNDLIDPLCVAALNTPADRASAKVLLRVLRDALFAGPGASDLLLPRDDLSALWPQPAARWLAARGARLNLGHRVQALAREQAHWRVDDEPFDAVVLAASAGEAARLTQTLAPDWASRTAAFEYEPIVTVVARSEGCRLPLPMLALRSDGNDTPAQFVFDLGQLRGDERAAGVLAFVVSAASAWTERGTAALTQAVLTQAQAQLGALLKGKGDLAVLRTLNEKRATFACVPGLCRPARHLAPGLCAAGDYVEGPYPATLEGAVRAGVQAARLATSAP
ncbi:MAG TPA: hydroxysqualene dehydroxylase HpnE [Burkholderiaceae bacterium]|nr:hydroxysqualene dehydroxylase HpnE [Burkholderiaceae bacterium]